MLYYLSQSYKNQNTKIKIRPNTKYKIRTCALANNSYSRASFKSQWYTSKIFVARFSGVYQKHRDTLFLRQPRNSNTPLVTLVLAFTYKLYIQVIHTYISHKLYKQVIEVIFFLLLFFKKSLILVYLFIFLLLF